MAGRNTSRVQRPVLILGSLDCIETGVRQLRRTEPLETVTTVHKGARIAIPTHAEILRIKAWLILQRNATRDYIDFVALAAQMRLDAMTRALANFDSLYPQDSGESVIQQLQA
ncbi:MAG: hypothetical protein OXF74_00305 [Rhodobacteraceae bacterium]|nr:hypothetical protein [Paracoccaceae bacterium]